MIWRGRFPKGSKKELKGYQGKEKDTKSARNLDCQRGPATDNPNLAPKVSKRDSTKEPREIKRKQKGAKKIPRQGKGHQKCAQFGLSAVVRR